MPSERGDDEAGLEASVRDVGHSVLLFVVIRQTAGPADHGQVKKL